MGGGRGRVKWGKGNRGVCKISTTEKIVWPHYCDRVATVTVAVCHTIVAEMTGHSSVAG